MLATAVTLPAWLVVLLAVASVIGAVANAGSSIATLVIQVLRLRQLHATVRKIGVHLGMSDEDLR